ncbi:MAG: neutral/alkaline non-lysosomal ceramidase N-terminal domain-containing protein [Bacillota bacterium]
MFKAGSASVEITPEVGVELAGWDFGPSKGILDPLWATSLVLELNDQSPVVLVSTDLIGIARKYIENIRDKIEKKFSIPSKNIFISATHTHSGPAAISLREWGKVSQEYISFLIKKIVYCVGKAKRTIQPARIGYNKDNIAKNYLINREFDNGVVDDELGLLKIEDLNGRIIALLTNFTCHPVGLHSINNKKISADYPGYIRKKIECFFNEEIDFFFLNGASGNINPSFVTPGGLKCEQEKTKKMGFKLGKEIYNIFSSLKSKDVSYLNILSHKVTLGLQNLPSVEKLQKEKKRWQQKLKNTSSETSDEKVSRILIELDYLKEAIKAHRKNVIKDSWEIEIQALRIDNFVLVGLPFEPYVEIGLKIKKKSPFDFTYIVELTNGAYSYLPIEKAFKKNSYAAGGLAHKVYGIYLVEQNSAEKVIRESIKLLKKV